MSDTPTPTSDPRAQPLRRADLAPDPHEQFGRWFRAARDGGVPMPEAVALATATPEGSPSARMVLMKSFEPRGFVFYSSSESRKAVEFAANPLGALCFYWHAVGRQVRIEGAMSRVDQADADEYWKTRPYGSQLSALASTQSSVVPDRSGLESRVAELRKRHPEGSVPRPESWGGYLLAPETYEFWQHRDDRLHDRFRYRREDSRWTIERLAP
jgi:pyridoxamine 5'-phosphate oxidase